MKIKNMGRQRYMQEGTQNIMHDGTNIGKHPFRLLYTISASTVQCTHYTGLKLY
jgi:hypothetical protein